MAEFEAFDDIGKNTKKLFKNKGFLIACVAVGGIALFLGWRKNQSSTTNEATAYEAIGYAGYPTVGGAEGGDTSSFYDYADEIYSILQEQLNDLGIRHDEDVNDINTKHDADISDLQSKHDEDINDLYNQIDEMGSNNDYFGGGSVSSGTVSFMKNAAAERQAILDQMKANSDAWHILDGDKEMQAALVAENQKLGASIGLSFDSQSGTWWDGGSIAYITPTQLEAAQKQKTVGNPNYANEWVSNTDYQKRINDAIINGSDATTINTLNTQRNAKIIDTGTNKAAANSYYDPNADYTTLIRKAKETGASQDVIDNLTAQRNAKIAANPDLQKYANDV